MPDEQASQRMLVRAALFERQRPGLLRWVVRRLGSWTEAQDVVADVAAELLTRDDVPGAESELRRWVLKRADRLLRSRRQQLTARGRRGPTLSLSVSVHGTDSDTDLLEEVLRDSGLSPADQVAGRLLGEAVREAVDRLPAADRALLLAWVAGGEERQEAVAQLTEGQAKWRLRMARRKLWRLLDGDLRREVERL